MGIELQHDKDFCSLFPITATICWRYNGNYDRRNEAEHWLALRGQNLGYRMSRFDRSVGVTIIYGMDDPDVAFEFKMRFG